MADKLTLANELIDAVIQIAGSDPMPPRQFGTFSIAILRDNHGTISVGVWPVIGPDGTAGPKVFQAWRAPSGTVSTASFKSGPWREQLLHLASTCRSDTVVHLNRRRLH